MPKMPEDWDDHPGWEAYYASLPSYEFWFDDETTSPGSFSFYRLDPLLRKLRENKWRTIWFPGCGFSPLPRTFALLGFTVYATDIAPSAIQYQSTNESIVQPLIDDEDLENEHQESGTLNAKVHDFRTPFGEHTVDTIFNIRAIQGLRRSSMCSAIRSHYTALRPGGIAFFDTMNVQGERRDQLEDALADAGFYVPLHALSKWYRKTLADTGIPHAFILGKPMIPERNDYPYPHKRGSSEYNRDVQILHDITNEYSSRVEEEYEREQDSIDETTKLAQVIYSTG